MSNSRFLSFLDSFNSCYKFRRAVEATGILFSDAVGAEGGGGRHRKRGDNSEPIWSSKQNMIGIFLCGATKFGCGTIVSILLHHTPTLLRGPRHVLSFLAAYVATFLSPNDVVYIVFRRNRYLSTTLGVSIALYKLRKLLFVTYHASDSGFLFTHLIAILAIEGNSILRNTVASREEVLAYFGFASSPSMEIRGQQRANSHEKGERPRPTYRQRSIAVAREGVKMLEVLIACFAVYSVCSSNDVHGSEPHFWDPIESVVIFSYSELYRRECAMSEDLSLTPCVLTKWIAFLVLIVRYCKEGIARCVRGASRTRSCTSVRDETSEKPKTGTRARVSRVADVKQGAEDDDESGMAFFFSPFKRIARRRASARKRKAA